MERIRILLLSWMTLVLLSSGAFAEASTDKTLRTLYEDLFRGSRNVCVPLKLFSIDVKVKEIFEIDLDGPFPFVYGTYQFEDNYEFPRLTNADESFYYFDASAVPSGKSEAEGLAFKYDKKGRSSLPISGVDWALFRREKLFGYYLNLKSGSDGILRLDLENDRAFIVPISDKSGYEILNPKDIDGGSNNVVLSKLVPTKSDFPYRQSNRDLELVVYDKAEKRVLKQVMLPFTGSYEPISTTNHSLQSVSERGLAYFVLNTATLSSPTLSVPANPPRWHLLVYDIKEDALYSIWHGMEEPNGRQRLSFSYFLGRDGLYFELLKPGKIEIYLVDIDLRNAMPTNAYETVDLLWNNKGLKQRWERKIQEEKAKYPSFQERWQ